MLWQLGLWLLGFLVACQAWKELQDRGVTYDEGFPLGALYWFALSILTLTAGWQFLFLRFAARIAPWLALLGTALLVLASARAAPRDARVPRPELQFVRWQKTYLATKAFELLWQQLMLALLFSLLLPFGVGPALVSFTAIVALLHALGPWYRDKEMGLVFLAASAAGAPLFAGLYLLENGIVYAYSLHWAWYAAVVAAYWKTSWSTPRSSP